MISSLWYQNFYFNMKLVGIPTFCGENNQRWTFIEKLILIVLSLYYLKFNISISVIFWIKSILKVALHQKGGIHKFRTLIILINHSVLHLVFIIERTTQFPFILSSFIHFYNSGQGKKKDKIHNKKREACAYEIRS
jgi:hypothetical protein